jgi:hypothetical protein
MLLMLLLCCSLGFQSLSAVMEASLCVAAAVDAIVHLLPFTDVGAVAAVTAFVAVVALVNVVDAITAAAPASVIDAVTIIDVVTNLLLSLF